MSERSPQLPTSYFIDESDPDILILRRSDGSFVAAFSARGASREGIVKAAEQNYRDILLQMMAGEKSTPLDEVPEELAVLDQSSTILTVNEAWRAFARANGGDPSEVSEGVNYLRVCDAAEGEQSAHAAAFARGLRRVLSREDERFSLEYPCHSPTERRWYVGRVGRIEAGGAPLTTVSHENVTARRAVRGN